MCIQRPPPGALSFSQHVASSAPPARGFSIPALLLKNSWILTLAYLLQRGLLLSRGAGLVFKGALFSTLSLDHAQLTAEGITSE